MARHVRDQYRRILQRRRGDCLRRDRILEPQWPDGGAPQRGQMRAAAQRGADVPRQRPQICPRADGRPKLQIRNSGVHDLQLADLHRPWLRHDRFAAPRPPVRPLAADLHRRVRRRALLVAAPESAHDLGELRQCDAGPGRRRDDRSRGVVGVGRDAEPDDALIRLRPPRGERREPRRAPDHEYQQSLGERVERAQMSDPILPQCAADDVHDIMRRGAGRLGDQQQPTVAQSSVSFSSFNTRSMRCACSIPRSRWKCSSGLVRRLSSFESCARRKRAALANPSSDVAFSSSEPMTLTRTLACDRSGETSTPVTVTNPILGSRTSPVRNTPTAWRITSLTRSGRRLWRLISEVARARIDDARAIRSGDQLVRLAQHALGMTPVRAHHGGRQLGTLPQILMPRLRDRHVEAVVHSILQALHDGALVLERLTRGQVQLPYHHAHDHDSAGLSERATSSMRYDSMRSLTLTSLKFSMPIPHSKPSRTSLTSSLNRFNDANVPSYTSTPLRMTRTRPVRGITPLRTKQPAIVPILAILKIWRTSASPSTTSFFSGASRPSIASFTSSTAS